MQQQQRLKQAKGAHCRIGLQPPPLHDSLFFQSPVMFSWVAFQLCLKIYYPYHIQSSIIHLLTVDFKSSSVFLNTKHYMLFTSYCLVLSRIFQSPLLPFPFKLGSKFRVAAEQWRGTCQILLTKMCHQCNCFCIKLSPVNPFNVLLHTRFIHP